MYRIALKRLARGLLCLVLLVGMVGTASAVTNVYLRAEATTLSVPDGLGGTTIIPAWGFAQDSAFGALDGIVSVPGPVLAVPPGETVLIVHMDNNLPDPVSLNINGLSLTNNTGPVWTELGSTVPAFTGSRPGGPTGNYTARVRSFSHETPSGNTTAVTYEFSLRPGTYLYASGTNPAKQVQMGLYGALKVDVAAGEAYPGVFYNRDLVLLYSEIDPIVNAAIAAGTYGAVPGATITSALKRDPKYFLVNGKAYDPNQPDGGGLDPVNAGNYIGQGQNVLIRFLNAGYEIHVPQLHGKYMSVVAEDGNPYDYVKTRYGAELPAGKTMDALYEAAETGKFLIYDAMLNQTNNGTPAIGGMLAFVETSACSLTWDIDPTTGSDGDVDGGDLQAAIPPTDLASFAMEFGLVCP